MKTGTFHSVLLNVVDSQISNWYKHCSISAQRLAPRSIYHRDRKLEDASDNSFDDSERLGVLSVTWLLYCSSDSPIVADIFTAAILARRRLPVRSSTYRSRIERLNGITNASFYSGIYIYIYLFNYIYRWYLLVLCTHVAMATNFDYNFLAHYTGRAY